MEGIYIKYTINTQKTVLNRLQIVKRRMSDSMGVWEPKFSKVKYWRLEKD